MRDEDFHGVDGTVLRLDVASKGFNPFIPFDNNLDDRGVGTGFVVLVGERPLLLTAHHVISNHVVVRTTDPTNADAEPVPLRVLGYNADLDVAVLESPPFKTLKAFQPTASSKLQLGDTVMAIGFAGGTMRRHATTGTVSSRIAYPFNRIQTDTVINSGNSGGPIVVKDSGRLVGVVTSSLTDIKGSNLFSGIDEVLLCVACILSSPTGVFLSHNLNAEVAPIASSAALDGVTQGGALVTAVMDGCPLERDDIIRAVEGVDGEAKPIDTYMRIIDRDVWPHGPIDFRAAFDRHTSGVLRLNVRRRGEMVEIALPLEPSRKPSRELRPDCEDVTYAMHAGVVVQRLSWTHALEGDDDLYNVLKDPQCRVDPPYVITHVVSGSPFETHGATALRRAVIQCVYDSESARHEGADIWKALSDGAVLVFELRNGHRVGATAAAIEEFERTVSNPQLSRGIHVVSRKTLPPKRRDQISEPEHAVPVTTTKLVEVSFDNGDMLTDEEWADVLDSFRVRPVQQSRMRSMLRGPLYVRRT